jgi:hypothetical protein
MFFSGAGYAPAALLFGSGTDDLALTRKHDDAIFDPYFLRLQ